LEQNTSAYTKTLSALFIIAMSIWGARNVAVSVRRVTEAYEMSAFYTQVLQLQPCDLMEGASWGHVVWRTTEVHNSGAYRICASDVLTEEAVVHRLLRKDHFFMGLMLDDDDDGVSGSGSGLQKQMRTLPYFATAFCGPNVRISMVPSLEWSLHFCILEFMFDDRGRLRRAFKREEGDGLALRFRLVGLVLVLTLPFALVYELIHFFLSNAQQFHFAKSYLGPRIWSTWALWRFRDYMEVPHRYEARMVSSFQPANAYLSVSQPPQLAKIAQLVAFISGALVASLLLASIAEEAIVLYVHAIGHNLLWWLGVLTAVYAGARAMIPSTHNKHGVPFTTPEALLDEVSAYTHHYPSDWAGHGNERKLRKHIRKDLDLLFPFKLKALLLDLLSAAATPFILLFTLPPLAPKIATFMTNSALHVEGVGDVFALSALESALQGHATAPNIRAKLESSTLSFKKTYPQWRPGPRCTKLLERLSERPRGTGPAAAAAAAAVTMGTGDGEEEKLKAAANVAARETSTTFTTTPTEYTCTGIPSVLFDVLQRENIDVEDHYWLNRFKSSGPNA
jgi:autophagy-related protein 9